MEEIKPGYIIQLIESAQEGWVGCLMIVDEVKDWGVLAYTKLPMQGYAYLRVKTGQFAWVGCAALIVENEGNAE